MKITMQYGNGGRETNQLIKDLFLKYFGNRVLNRLEDAAIVRVKNEIAMTTDSFVVDPLIFNGGDIGALCVCGTANDLTMVGAKPKYLTIGFIISQNLEFDKLEEICKSIAERAEEARVKIVAGDTKVIDGDGGLYINTSGIGFVQKRTSIAGAKDGDVVIVSGNLGDHHAAILSARMGIDNNIKSDVAPLIGMVKRLWHENVEIHALRDITRGGLGGILNEIAVASNCEIVLNEASIPVSDDVRGLCSTLGLDPLYMGNEGKMALIVPSYEAARALEIMREHEYGKNAFVVGLISEGKGVVVRTKVGGNRILPQMSGDGLPRIC